MDAHSFPIKKVIQGDTILRIPYFQRRYVWTVEDWERFANDMEDTLDSKTNYFLGAIILKDEDEEPDDRRLGISKRQLVVDGQQRLTTLAIFMKLLYMMTSRGGEFKSQYLQPTANNAPVIVHNCEDKLVFSNIMHLSSAHQLDAKSRIEEAYNFFHDYLEKKKNEVNLNDLLNTVNSSVNFVVIELNDKDDEQQIFDTINSLGVPLRTDELLKNFLYEAKDEQAYLNNWRKVFDVDDASKFWETDAAKSRQEKSKKNITIERFFHAFVRIKMWDFKDQLTESQKKSFVKMENTFATCKSFCNDFGVDKQELANEIIEYAKLFKEHLSDSVLDIRVPQHAGIKRLACFINATKTYAAIPYVLYILRNVKSEAERNNIFEYMESYLVRRAICKTSNNNYSDLFSEQLIGGGKNTLDLLKEYIEERVGSLEMPSASKVVFGVSNYKMDEQTARIIYYLYETKLTKTSEKVFVESYKTCLAEQFMPKSCADADVNWPKHADKDQEVNRQELIGTLGNYFLLRVDDNEKAIKKAHNEGFAKKLSCMLGWCKNVRSCQKLTPTLPGWQEKDINARNNHFAKLVNENIWTV